MYLRRCMSFCCCPCGKTIPTREALARSNKHLESARKAQGRKQALKLCSKAESALKGINLELVVSEDQPALEQIIAAYEELGKALEAWDEAEKAKESYNKARELRDTLWPTSPQSTVFPGKDGSQSSGLVLASIFTKDCDLYAFHGGLPKPDERLHDTHQLAYCLTLLLQGPAELDNIIDAKTLTWLQETHEDTDEQERLKDIAKDLLREFTREELKDSMAVAEVVCVAPVLEKQYFRLLLGQFVNTFSSSVLLDTPALEGLDELIQSAPKDSIEVDDLVKILKHLNSRLKGTRSDSPDYIYHLTCVVSHALDAMVLGGVQGLNRVDLHTPLTEYLQNLLKSSDPYLAFQAAYASQALLWISNDEDFWKAALRRATTVTTGLSRLVSATKAFNVVEFIDGLSKIQEGLEGVGEFIGLVSDTFTRVNELIDSRDDFKESLKEGLSFTRKRKWYLVLRAADTLLRDGELMEFENLVRDAPCRLDVAFQWGVCQRLGSVASDARWDIDTRQGAIAFLGEIYRYDAAWGRNVQVKQGILNILAQLGSKSCFAMQAAESLLDSLRTNGDTTKQAMYQVCLKERSTPPRPWKVIPPLLKSSPLLDRVQKKPDLRPCLRKFRRERLEGRGQKVYIPLEAKACRLVPDDVRFSLMDKAKEFMCSDQEVLLVLGDSGTGKSDFTRELEWEMWDAYDKDIKDDKDKARIPIFVWLPAVDRPEKDIIGQRLKDSDFNEGQIRELKEHYKFVLICDGYDECQLTSNLYNTNELNKAGKWQAKMVVSCRSEYLNHDYHDRFQPKNSDFARRGTQLQEAVIAPFSTSMIQLYVKKYIEKNAALDGPLWKVEDYLRVFDEISGLKDLVRNPFLLSLSLTVLPEMIDLGQKLSCIKVTRIALYDNFMDQWMNRGKVRLQEKKMNEIDKNSFEDLRNHDFSHAAICFFTDLAVAIFENQDGVPLFEHSPRHNEDDWQYRFFTKDKGTHHLREVCPIKRIGVRNQYQFIQRSVLEYGLARAAFEPRRGREGEHIGTSMDQGMEQGLLVNVDPALDSSSPLCRKNYVNKPSVLRFLAERVQLEPEFKNQLHSFIEQSGKDEKWKTAAANAITILVKAGIRFNGANLKGIRISGADLTGGQFDSAQLQGADLSNTTLRHIWLRQANLSNARMAGVEFRELPYLKEESEVICVTYSPDGKSCIFGLKNGEISVYDTTTWSKIDTLKEHTEAVNCVVYSPDGQQIASGSDDDTVQLWDAHTREPGSVLSGHDGDVNCVVYSLDGQQIASGSADTTVRLWNAQTGESGPILKGHTEVVKSVTYSPSGQRIASGSWDETVRLWDAQTGAAGSVLNNYPGPVLSVVYSPDGRQIASGSDDDKVRLWDAQTSTPGPILSGHTSDVTSVVYSPTGQQIATGSYDMTVRLWDTETGAQGLILSGHTSGVRSVAYSPNGLQIASGSDDMTVRLWDAHTGVPGMVGYTPSGHSDSVRRIVFSPSGHQIASASADMTVRLWGRETGAPGFILTGHTGIVESVVYSPNGQQIATGSFDKTVRLWDAQTSAPGPILSGHVDTVTSVVYSPNGQQIASGSFDATVRLWDAQTGVPGLTMSGHSDSITSVAYSPSGEQIASGSFDTTVRLWDAQTGVPGFILSGHTDRVNCVTYSSSGLQIASGSDDTTVRLWDAQTGAPGLVLEGHILKVWSVVYLPCRQRIGSGSNDNTVRLWDVSSGQCLAVVNDFYGLLRSITWNVILDGTYLGTGCDDGSVRMWRTVDEKSDGRNVHLEWTSKHDKLVVSNTSFQGVQGLSELNMQLLQQRGALGKLTDNN